MNAVLLFGVLAVLGVHQTNAAAKISPYLYLKHELESPARQSLRTDFPNMWVEQRLDNFDPQNRATFRTRYLENDEFFTPNGPLFIFIGGEWSIEPSFISGGHFYDMARQYNATMMYTEHRYYGISWPHENMSARNMRFLTIEQGMADLANFIAHIKGQLRYANSKVFLTGGSYSATMATWFRQLYPHLAVGSWASSPPLKVKVDHTEYFEAVGATLLEYGGQACYDRTQNAFAAAEQLIQEERLEEFRELFGFCPGFSTNEDIWLLYTLVTRTTVGKECAAFRGSHEVDCTNLMQNTTAESTDLSEFARFIRSEVIDCTANFEESLVGIRDESLQSVYILASVRQWLYQQCSELGWFFTTGSSNQPFGSSVPLEYHNRFCDLYDGIFNNVTIHENVARKNVIFGEWNSRVTNVYFTNGLADPWRMMSIMEDLNPSSPADVIPDAGHCQDFGSISDEDNKEMVAAKRRIAELVGQWLGVH